MRFKIGETIYESASMDEVSLRDLMLFNTQAAALGIDERWVDVERVLQELDDLDEAGAEEHPQKFLALAAMVWVTRRAAGDVVTFGEAIDVPLGQITFLPEPEDHKPGKPEGAKEPLKGSGPDESPAEPGEDLTTPPSEESESVSTPG